MNVFLPEPNRTDYPDAGADASDRARKPVPVWSAFFSAAILICWVFPEFWYSRSDAEGDFFWLGAPAHIEDWTFQEMPVAKSAEAVLVADAILNGEFKDRQGRAIRFFSARRFQGNRNEIGLFVHTPDRCWTGAGWELEPAGPDRVEVAIGGIPVPFERRIFAGGGHRELVYFCGLVGGQPLPYRLDHNLSVALRNQMRQTRERTGTLLRGSDQRFWGRVWDSFGSRRRLLGPKQFVRISTAIPGEVEEAETRLRNFMATSLAIEDYETELRRHFNARN